MEYIIQISEERSITKAAEKLFITQSALNQQLQKLEKELGIALYPYPLRLAADPAGEIYVNTARQILNLKKRRLQPDPGLKRKRKPAHQPGTHPGTRRQYVHRHLPGISQKVPGHPD